jgi:hypothetical protein
MTKIDFEEGMGEYGEGVPGPPWILGHRGSPRDTPENTLVSLRRALDLGLDGVEYDVQGSVSGEPVLLHDDTLDRTTSLSGPVSLRTLPELAALDAGGWFHKRFVGEPLPLLEEALDLPGCEQGDFPQHMIELKDPALVGEVARQIGQLSRPLSVRLASFHRGVCVEARDLGLSSMLLAFDANEEDRRFVRDERIEAYGTASGGWGSVAGDAEWACERWSFAVDDPAALLDACRRPLNGLNTNYPRRALATRALARLTPHDRGPFPIRAPRLEVEPGGGRDAARARGRHGEWSGRWGVSVGLRNPFGFPVEVALTVAVYGGAFDLEGVPVTVKLTPGEECEVPLALAGGSWSPGDDPLLLARFVGRAGPGRPRESLILDAPLSRVRTLTLGDDSRRLLMLCERPAQLPSTMTLRRRGRELLTWVEAAGGLHDVRAVLRLGAEVRHGGRGVRVPLPADWETRGEALPFSVGFEGREEEDSRSPRVLRRWAGGLPLGLRSGAPGRLFLRADA